MAENERPTYPGVGVTHATAAATPRCHTARRAIKCAGYLSTKACSSSQDVVDEWPVLDGSGRQQWRLVLPPGATYPVTGGPVYLQVRRCRCRCCCS